jgi:hypothetical protein
MAVLAVGSSAMQMQEAATQQNYADAVAKQNADVNNKAADENYKLQNRQLNLQQLQEDEQGALAKHEQGLAVQKQIATQRTSSGESGVSGISIDSLFSDTIRQGANNMTTIDRNMGDSNDQRDVQKQGLVNNTWASYQNPSFYKGKNRALGKGLQLASAGVQGYAAGGGTFGGLGGAGKVNMQGQSKALTSNTAFVKRM